MTHAFKLRVLPIYCYVYTASCYLSLLKLEECIKLLSWPMPSSREYYLFYCPYVYCPALLSPYYSLFLNWKNVLNFFHGPCLWVESITNLLPVYVLSCFIVSWLLSLLKLEECSKLLSWPMPLSWEYYIFTALRYYLQLSSLLKLEECIKLLSWPMPLSWEYQLSADQLLLSLATSLFLNWKNVLNFFHGPSL